MTHWITKNEKLTTFIVLITLAVLLSGCATLFRNKAVDIPKIEIAKPMDKITHPEDNLI